MAVGQMDCRNWDEDLYRDAILQERETLTRTVFRTAFAPNPSPNPNSDHIVAASSDGAIASYSISSCLVISTFYLLSYTHVITALSLILSTFLILAGAGLWNFEGSKVCLINYVFEFASVIFNFPSWISLNNWVILFMWSWLVAEPGFLVQGHDGPAYDVKFYDESLLLRY